MENKQVASRGRGKHIRQEEDSDSYSERYNVPTQSFQNSSVLSGKVVKFDDFCDFRILELFEFHGCVEFACLNELYYPDLVWEFYKNLKLVRMAKIL